MVCAGEHRAGGRERLRAVGSAVHIHSRRGCDIAPPACLTPGGAISVTGIPPFVDDRWVRVPPTQHRRIEAVAQWPARPTVYRESAGSSPVGFAGSKRSEGAPEWE